MKSPTRSGPERHGEITINLYCHGDNSHSHFTISPQLSVGELLRHMLVNLARGKHATRLQQFCDNYEPVLELLQDDGAIELENEMSLAAAGVGNNATCQIAARPLKERLMFCRYASGA
jgi:phosphotransferase system HPr-like phosphotransfer protein